jgi:DNA mismatch repair protein MutL
MKGRYPVCCLFLEIDPADVDVNIHPSKREVKFHNEMSVRRAVAQAVREALTEFHTGQARVAAAHAVADQPTAVEPSIAEPAKASAISALQLEPERVEPAAPEQRALALPPTYPTLGLATSVTNGNAEIVVDLAVPVTP